jgi:exosortase O
LSAAESVRNILSQFNLNGIAKETIITIENRSADVSEACSGLNGIWTSWLFYFALSWIENKKITVYWILNFVFLNLLIYSCNLFRIFILVLLETVFNLHDIAEIVHVPMGIAGFVFSCFICWYLFSYFPENKKETHEKVRMNELTGVKPEMHKYYLASFTLLSVLIPLTILPASARQQIHNFDFRWSLALPAIEIGLSEGEKSAFLKDGSAGRKYRFSKGEIYGTILLVSSRGWRGHHPPQLCTQANGFVIESSETRLIDSEFPVQFLSLKNTKTRSCFWFQSAELITQDHSSRVWAGLRNNTSEWIMVSVLFDNYQGGNDAPVTDFLKEVKSVISVYLQH